MAYLWPKLGRILGVSRAQLQVLLGDGGDASAGTTPAVSQAVASDDMKRRTFMKWGVAATAIAGLGVGSGTAVGMADVQRLQRTAARLHSLDQQHGGGMVWQAALSEAQHGAQLLEHGSYAEAVGRQLLTAAGRLQLCAGWLAFDAGQHEVAKSCFGEALSMSRHAKDVQVETRALANLAFQSNVLSRPREALRYAVGAEQAATQHGSAPWLATIPQLRLAVGNAKTGDARGTEHAIGKARRALEGGDSHANEEWSSFLSPLEIDAIEATCALELQQPERAERLLEQAVAGYAPQYARNRATYQVRLARARLDMGAADGAAEAADSALDDLAERVTSWRVANELDAVARRMTAYRKVPGVEPFLVRYEAAS